jgi:hypothetical protein
MATKLIVTENNPLVVVRSSGAPGRTIISGGGNPDNTLGVPGDFYFDTNTTRFWGPKALTNTWNINNSFILKKLRQSLKLGEKLKMFNFCMLCDLFL